MDVILLKVRSGTQGVKDFPPPLHPHPLVGVAPTGGNEWRGKQDFFSVVAEANDVVFAVYCADKESKKVRK